jgi:hypothetical protein
MEDFLSEYIGYAIGAFGMGWGLGTIFTFAKSSLRKYKVLLMSKLVSFGKSAKVSASAIVLMVVSSAQAMAALPPAISTSLDTISTDGLALADLVWPVLLALLGAVILMKLAKRFLGKV